MSTRRILLVCLALTTTLAAQTRTRRSPDADLNFRSGCPRPLAPATNNLVAAGPDSVELERTGCSGQMDCPAYYVKVTGDGIVTWHGYSGVQVVGYASGTIDTTAARGLLQQIADRNFTSLCLQYGTGPSSAPTYRTTLMIAGNRREIDDYAGTAPSFLRELDRDIDRVADTHRWRHGDNQHETFAGDHLAVDAREPKAGVTRFMKLAAIRDSLPELRLAVQDTAANLNERDSTGWTPLMYAAQSGPLEAMQLLLAHGADPLLRSNAGETAMSAAVSARIDADQRIYLLQKAGLSVGERYNRGVSPLMLACKYAVDREKMIRVLLDLGADPQQRDANGRTAADYLPEEAVALKDLLALKKDASR